jgi:D-serine deaminase-like pyridoxal phosphate-dependent protein
MNSLQNPPLAQIAPDVLRRICSPALLFFPERITANIQSMLRMVGYDPARLRPHVKTHKCGKIVRQLVNEGITRHKCATLREAEVLAENGATDILLAYPAVGPLAIGLSRLAAKWPKELFSTVIDSPTGWADLSNAVRDTRVQLGIFLEIDVGHGRTGVSELDFAVEFARDGLGVARAAIGGADTHRLFPKSSRYFFAIAVNALPPVTLRDAVLRRVLGRRWRERACVLLQPI